jgi:MoaA/NifB/PqqE/SkfB family radical SAM enzyme
MKDITGIPSNKVKALRRKMTLWGLPIFLSELARRPSQFVRIIKRYRRMDRTVRLMLYWTKVMKFGGDDELCTKVSVYAARWPSKAVELRFRRALRNDNFVPEQIAMAITDECPYKCRHCSNAHKTKEPLPLNRLIEAIKEIQEIGGSWINIGGGEPAVAFDRAIAVVKAGGEHSETWFNTTGFGLDVDKIKQLKDAGLFGTRISIHSCDPSEHDEFVGYPGAFKIATEAVENFRKHDVFPVISAAVPETSITEELVFNFMKMGREVGAGFIEVLPIRPAGRAVIQCTHSELERHEVSGEIFHKLNNDSELVDFPAVNSPAYLEAPDKFGCVAGSDRIYISTAGDVQPCPLVGLSAGNLKDEPFKDIWQRMNKYIPRPRAERLCSQLSPIISEQIEQAGGSFDILPIPPDKSRKFFEELPESKTPNVWSL